MTQVSQHISVGGVHYELLVERFFVVLRMLHLETVFAVIESIGRI